MPIDILLWLKLYYKYYFTPNIEFSKIKDTNHILYENHVLDITVTCPNSWDIDKILFMIEKNKDKIISTLVDRHSDYFIQ